MDKTLDTLERLKEALLAFRQNPNSRRDYLYTKGVMIELKCHVENELEAFPVECLSR